MQELFVKNEKKSKLEEEKYETYISQKFKKSRAQEKNIE